jgi:hypothetical protein
MGDCSCIYMVEIDNPASFVSSRLVRARKNHFCCECAHVITPGERYERTFGVWDGEVEIYKTCLVCKELRDAFFCDGWQYTTVMEDLDYHILEMKGEIAESCLANLTSLARDRICSMIEEYWGETD